MKRSCYLKVFLHSMCIVVPHLFAVEISNDTVLVNNFNPAGGLPVLMTEGIDTIALWNTTNSQVTLDSLDIIVNPSQDGQFRYMYCGQMYTSTEPTANSRITIALYTYKDTRSWVYSWFAYHQSNRLFRMYKDDPYGTPGLGGADFFPFFSINGSDTCFIHGVVIASCFTCVNQPAYSIDFSGQITFYYSDGSKVSFHIQNTYSPEVKIKPTMKIHDIKRHFADEFYSINGQKRNHSASNYSPGIYLCKTMNGCIGSKLLLNLNSSANAPSFR